MLMFTSDKVCYIKTEIFVSYLCKIFLRKNADSKVTISIEENLYVLLTVTADQKLARSEQKYDSSLCTLRILKFVILKLFGQQI